MKLYACFKVFGLTLIFVPISFASGYQCNPFPKSLYAAENRALHGFVYARRLVRSRVVCGRDCSMDKQCKSFNFNDCNLTCELNLVTRQEHPGDFSASQGSVYFDDDGNTPLYSLPDTDGCLISDAIPPPTPSVTPLTLPKDCSEAFANGVTADGVYTVQPVDDEGPFSVYCDMKTDAGGWTVFQRRQDGSVDFYRDWVSYRQGFGDLNGEFWLGNDNLHRLTAQGVYRLRVDLEDFENNTAYAVYNTFRVADGRNNYRLRVARYSGTAGNSLARLQRVRPAFSTKDRDNDSDDTKNCAVTYSGAWWYRSCHSSNLNGMYLRGWTGLHAQGIIWFHWKGNRYSLKRTEMKIKYKG
ncbi:ficolin-2-like isoform X2 [Acanthaster planci]|uniref:Ficolin-2-like isoform X2 n=1 Tax=Acanthaster planci TaxID=133434 RepID=A0A8B7ZV88_ACAPL|nr:ficolin-2-like isoform X2 [Acanthaster planci]